MNKIKANPKTKKRIFITAALCLALAAVSAGAAGLTRAAGEMAATPMNVWSEVDWNEVGGEIDAVPRTGAAQRETKIIDLNTGTLMEVPMETLRKLVGKNVALAMHAGDGVAVSAFGREVAIATRNLKITLTDEEEEEMIPGYVSQTVLPGAIYCKMFAMEEKEDYGIQLNIHFSLDRGFAGKYANLYHFDELAEAMVYDDSFIITADGKAVFALNRGDEYILTVTDDLCAGGKTVYTVVDGDSLTRIAKKVGVSLQSLIAANPGIEDTDKIYPGELLAVVKQ